MSSPYTAHKQTGLLLNANENSRKPSPLVLEKLIRRLETSSLNRYPQDSASELIDTYARLYQLDPAGILAGNGSDAMLQVMINTFCRQGKNLVTLIPDFGMYGFYTSAMQAEVCAFETEWDGSFDLDQFIAFIQVSNPGLVLFSNPNNPTGHELSKNELLTLAKAIAPAILAVDEAYMDFSDQSLLDVVQQLDNVIVTRTLSKAWGLAGIRCGFLVTNPSLKSRLDDYRIVYSVSSLDQLAAICGLQHPEFKDEYVKLVNQEARRMEKELQALDGLHTGPFHANFFAITTEDASLNQKIEAAFARENIQVRTWPASERIRITIGLPEENERILAILKQCMLEQDEAGERGL